MRTLLNPVQAAFRDATIGPAIVVWAFGYALVGIVTVVLRGTAPAIYMPLAVPMLILGVAQTVALARAARWMRRHGPARRWPAVLAGLLAAASLQSLFDMHWVRFVALTLFPDWQSWALDVGLERFATNGVIYLWTFSLALVLIWAMGVSVSAQRSATRAASAEAAAARAQAAALRLQLNPHFMFNTLNSISSLVLTDRKREADEMLGRLSEFLRSSLQSDPTADVPLSQEIDTIDAYLGLEATRFGDALSIDIAVDPELADAPVPNFIFQPLVENAIKHGAAKTRMGAFLNVCAEREGEVLLLSVRNSVPTSEEAPLPDAKPDRAAIGLENTRRRLADRYGEDASLVTHRKAGEHYAAIRIPLATPPGTPAPASR